VAAYRVEVATRARRDLERLAPALVERLGLALMTLADDPRPRSSQKLAGIDAYRVRVGDYRAIYEIDDRARVVIVSRIRHRREVYRKLR
jgi:mRNA interferase RelE/StbE